LLPGFIKLKFPYKVGIMTGVYSVFMNIFAALASGLSVPLLSLGDIGWEGSLVFWSIPAFLAIAVWIPQLKKMKNVSQEETVERKKTRSEEHTSELQSRFDLVCRLLLEKKK